MFIIVNTAFIFYFYIENALAGDIFVSEYKSYLSVGTMGTPPSPAPKSNNLPIVMANGPYCAAVNQNIFFDGSRSYDPDGIIINYKWDFGDNSNGSGVNPNHTYSKVGKYTITLTVADDNGDTASGTAQVTIARSKSVHLLRFCFLQRVIDRFLRLARLLYLPVFGKLLNFQ
jgi:hypothetical protein